MRVREFPTPEMFSTAVHLHLGGKDLDFDEAKHAAYERARTYSSDPMLLSWFERTSGSYFMKILECCDEVKPS